MRTAAPTTHEPRPSGTAGSAALSTIREDPLGFLAGTAARHPDRWWHETDGESVYVVNHPDLARHVLRDNQTNYTKADTPDDQMLTPLLGEGLLTTDGEVWARQRRLAAPSFRRQEIERFDGLITGAALDLVADWQAAAAAGRPVRVDHDLTGLTLRIVVAALLGTDMESIGPGFGQAVDAVNRYIGHVDPSASETADLAERRIAYLRAKQFLTMVVNMLIGARTIAGPAHGSAPDLLTTLLAPPGGGDGFSAGELHDQVLTMIMAGHETTAKALTWTLHLLAGHPEILEAVRTELDTVLGGRTPTAADLPMLSVTRAAIDEAIRIFPPVWLLSRRAIADDVVAGEKVPAGSLICLSPWLLHRHPDFWTAPEEYRPERFLMPANSRPSHLYIPFGGGPRICLGQYFALTEATLVLATVLPRIGLRPLPGHVVEPEALVTLRPRDGVLMYAEALNA
jgi:cytochrome P450